MRATVDHHIMHPIIIIAFSNRSVSEIHDRGAILAAIGKSVYEAGPVPTPDLQIVRSERGRRMFDPFAIESFDMNIAIINLHIVDTPDPKTIAIGPGSRMLDDRQRVYFDIIRPVRRAMAHIDPVDAIAAACIKGDRITPSPYINIVNTCRDNYAAASRAEIAAQYQRVAVARYRIRQ